MRMAAGHAYRHHIIGTTERLRWILPLRDLVACSEGGVLEAFTFGSSVLESYLYSMSSHNLNYSPIIHLLIIGVAGVNNLNNVPAETLYFGSHTDLS